MLDISKMERRLDFIEDLKEICLKYDVRLGIDEHNHIITLEDREFKLETLTDDDIVWLNEIDFEDEEE